MRFAVKEGDHLSYVNIYRTFIQVFLLIYSTFY